MSFWIFLYVLSTEVFFSTDETITGYAERNVVYQLVELNGAPVDTTASVRFPGRQIVEARSPCFTRRGRVTHPTPWFNFKPTKAIELGCIKTPFEDEFRAALTTSTLVETAQGVLIFSNDDGPVMVLRAARY